MRILVCGSRSWPLKDYVQIHVGLDLLVSTLRQRGILAQLGEISVIHGAAAGVDRMADRWARFWDLPRKPMPADWNRYGKAAGIIRNESMLAEAPDVVVAFRMPGKSNGTDNMLSLARRAGVMNLMLEWKQDGLKGIEIKERAE